MTDQRESEAEEEKEKAWDDERNNSTFSFLFFLKRTEPQNTSGKMRDRNLKYRFLRTDLYKYKRLSSLNKKVSLTEAN